MPNIKILIAKDFLRLTAFLALIYIVLELYYHFFISDNFGYMGFTQDLNLLKYFVTKMIFLGFIVFSYSLFRNSKFLYVTFLLLLFFFYIPNAIFFSFSNGNIAPYISNVIFISVFFITPYLNFYFPSIKLIKNKYKSSIMVLAVFVFIVPIIIVYKLEYNLNTLLLKDIYETREVFSEKMGGYLSYLYHILVKTIIPVALVFFMIKNKKWMVFFLVIALLYLFIISGNKIVYFNTFLLLFFYYFGSSYIAKISNFFMSMLLLLILIPVIDTFIFKSPLLGGTFVNRFLFIPALLTQWYFEFFDGNPYYFAESSFFNLFVESPYDMPVGFLITKVYWNEPTVYANNGIVSDGFMNLGYFGVILFSIIFACLFGAINSFKLNKGYFGVIFSFIFIFLSMPFLSSFITGGVIVFFLLGFFLLREEKISL